MSCKKGKPDYYYAFIESALGALAQDGKLIYLVPGNFMKNLFSDNLRKLLLPSLHHIVDYSHHKLFENVLTSSVILFCDMTNSSPLVHYEDRHYKRTYKMPKALMQGKWTFDEQSKDGLVPFSSCFHASAPVATQLNEAFVVSNWSNQQNDTITVNNFELEKSVLRDAAGPKALRKNAQEKIIFPYFYDAEGNVNGYSEEQFKRCFPGAYNYLLSYKERLLRRKADKNAKWFEYGRSQLLQHLLQEKLVLSSFVTKQPRIYRLACDVVPYAGICVVAENNFTIIQAQKVLSSPEFMEYVQKIGVCTNGISYRISPTDINSFCFPHRLLEE